MQDDTLQAPEAALFHAGEIAIQTRVGRQDMAERFGRRAIHNEIPEQHRAFYSQLPFLVIGSVDEQDWPWASLVCGRPGFAHSPESQTLQIDAMPDSSVPLAAALKSGAPLGLLGIEMPTRRRNRLNANVAAVDSDGFTVTAVQAFGNCPRFIQTRAIEFVREPQPATAPTVVKKLDTLDDVARQMIATADTFFVSSYLPTEVDAVTEGVDVSHRGGLPGFVKVEGNTLTIPDYSGNNLFNTLGNFLLNPKAGLIFSDFSTGNVLMLTGTVEIHWEDSPEALAFEGADRAWKFTLDHGLCLEDALPFRAEFGDYSPATLKTGHWPEPEKSATA